MSKYFGIISLIIYSILVLILVINEKKKSLIIKYSFIVLFFGLSMFFLHFNQTIINYLFKMIIEYIYFPDFTVYLISIFSTLCILIYSIFSEKMCKLNKVINYIFSALLIVSYIKFMTLNVDVSLYNELYSSSSLLWLRIGTRGFLLWIIIMLIIKYFRYFVKNR